jgi:mono/diheme cytochrome c family protein
MRHPWHWSIAGLITILVLAHGMGQAQSRKPMPPLLTDSLVGRDLYDSYCASCHGRTGRGDGPVAPALKKPPADLTTLARRHGGAYPAALVEATLNGTREPDPAGAHGSSEMPIWGALFRQLDSKESVAKVRVDSLVTYLATIQTP